MGLYEIINPSDDYTLECEDFVVACLATLALGNGWYGLKPVGDGQEMPILAFGFNEWLQDTFGKPLNELLDASPFEAIAACLETVLVGKPNERRLFHETLLSLPDDEARQAFRNMWHDTHRSSVNDIGKRAAVLAKAFRKRAMQVATSTSRG